MFQSWQIISRNLKTWVTCTLFPRYPIMPVPTHEAFRLLICWYKSAQTQTHKKIQTICLLAAKQNQWCTNEFYSLVHELGLKLLNMSKLFWSCWSSIGIEYKWLFLGCCWSLQDEDFFVSQLIVLLQLAGCSELSCRFPFIAWRIKESHLIARLQSSGLLHCLHSEACNRHVYDRTCRNWIAHMKYYLTSW